MELEEAQAVGAVLPTLAELESAAAIVYRHLSQTPQLRWPLLGERCGGEVWVKHENHTRIGAFKVRGGLVYMDRLTRSKAQVPGVITATRGNHGQSVAFAARRYGVPVTIVVPHGNNPEKNAAMRALGATLIEHGHDFQAAYEHSLALAQAHGLHCLRTFHPWLVQGVASYALELLRAVPDLHTVYVPIGQGSGICGMVSARDALGLKTRIVGVVAEKAATYALSFARGRPVPTDSADTIADGVACRVPDDNALQIILKGVERVVSVSDEAILAAMRHYFTDTHNLAEGAGAAPLAALLRERAEMAGKRVALILSGGNADRILFARALTADEAAGGQ
jgi:threonine dehydratase